jgi:hypothetical protein
MGRRFYACREKRESTPAELLSLALQDPDPLGSAERVLGALSLETHPTIEPLLAQIHQLRYSGSDTKEDQEILRKIRELINAMD